MMDLEDLAHVTLVAGAPRSGKTEFALDMLIAAMKRYGDANAVMTVSGRQIADMLGDRAIRELSAVSQARPVTTLSAVAFRLLAAARSAQGKPLPKLLNGAEQDVIIRKVLASHVEHRQHGDECATCDLLRVYFAVSEWSGLVADDSTDAFANQLRDMLARMNEIGAKPELENMLIARAASRNGELDARRERLRTQWRLAFALREEYNAAIRAAYSGEYRLDASQLMIDATEAVSDIRDADIPNMLIVDDFQDATLAGFALLEALHNRGTRLLLVGNPDEAVQTFRGSYPEYLFNEAQSRMGARLERIENLYAACENDGAQTIRNASNRQSVHDDYRTLVATRVSLSIASTEPTDVPLPERPGKMRNIPGAMPIEALPSGNTDACVTHADGSVETALYRSSSEELDDVVWKIKTEHLQRSREWNDMAVITHDNATVRAFGERLRADGVPVRYSSVTRPLKDEPFVQGLFALIELAELKRRTIAASGMDPQAAGSYIRSRVASIMASPLITVGGDRRHEGRPARLASVESAMHALASLAEIVGDDEIRAQGSANMAKTDVEQQSSLLRLMADWHEYMAKCHAISDEGQHDGGHDGDQDDLVFDMDALYVLLLEGNTDRVIDTIASVTGSDPQVKAFASLWKVLDKTCEAERKLVLREPQYVLDCAWRACGKAEIWQRVALEHSAAGRAANDRLDAAMRLFNYASGGESSGEFAARTIEAFMEQVRSLTIEADSLAHTAPIDQAVTLTTPAGAAGRHWNLVFLPSLQQGQWPNLTPRNTLFGGEELADVMLHGELSDTVTTSAGKRDAQLAAVLASEQKSFLVALTRADECAVMSAVLNDDHVPSDFLYGYVPEWFDRDRDADMERREYAAIGSQGDYAGLESDPRGLIAAARSVLAMEPPDSPKARDAAETLALLASRGMRAADPDCWPFVEEPVSLAERETIQDGKTRQSDVVTLSPSAVDNLWACPVCWMLENRFSGPRMGSVATNFGSLIHAVAQKATEAGLDMPEQHTAISDMDNIDAITEQMYAEYERLRGDLNGITDPAQRYQALKKDEQAKDALRNIATYFVQSNHGDYPIKNNDAFSVGKLTKAEPELKFTAKFDFDDILAAYNAMDGIHAISRNELIAIMGTLVGGWPQTGMSEHLTVRLTGRIDRVERRDMADGTQQVRLIDYKTGASPNGEGLFNDLQLVCYQLGLVFPEGSGLHGAQAVAAAPNITQSALFYVAKHAFPAPYGNTAAESHMQQALFANGSLNTGVFVPRYYVKKLDKDFQDGLDEMLPPMEVSDEHWSEFVGLRNTMAVWSLTMIARVFYAAAASRANEITARPTSEHMKYCRNTAVCPACAGEQNTVFERRTA
ncbi:PD-(D/E)XK nuclease family protein [Bifidobacterium catenulatum subsp. kashiwanohense]|uniref:PD-(D/E)XK nuclease family protein n=1 Tax=Bifidobacterium catenulatum subsp. kashiwanohense TaxID=630129 RepID=A0AAJ1UNW1_9BIFI|nr:PD-(D/E)XK nuclease family protein [Bifidobacterium catenulatum]MDH7871836.1 PD-(D/E)XK nuclease family protein [Bifidobacterium catenulatum subsp. kashiwanohense]MDH7886694.1 PD-(D/E)XK nuclease family protein [Bifidobacterium catenulatum subsp. kashiwanohense]MDH7888651.1 PD-(D/E)XK nuclease family protein [Bifidobacterium catenulatum subsp. kashiwanohense]MDH7900279.1 PD-(D/E)XK nuclease family protein [Bifidobacterium catenulatum subsp. kashiwanohense]MDH7906162.1 PD-(D/E)XK nuclease fa